ncbi:MAG: hypothetical protein OXG58_05130 [Gemmatimonadetes bacterium]|nr:hypothetical protein [Gemmatimonadota bacterium]MCY3942976.1 hypothetical protein [Gemmatimonadota bacterium]
MPMQRRSTRRGAVRSAVAALSLPIAAAVGCGDDEPITEAEAMALLSALGNVGRLLPSSVGNLNTTIDCPDGGTLAYAGTASGDPVSGIMFDVKMTASMCKFTSRGSSFEIAGGSVDQVGTVASEETSVLIDMALDGSLDWSLPEKEGKCAVDVDVDATGSLNPADGLTGPVTGMMCGHSVNVDASEFAPPA